MNDVAMRTLFKAQVPPGWLRAAVLIALYERADANGESLDWNRAVELAGSGVVLSVNGRRLSIDLSGGEVDASRYDAMYGENAFLDCVLELIANGADTIPFNNRYVSRETWRAWMND